MFRRFIVRGIPIDLEDEYILKELKVSNQEWIFEDVYRFKKKVYVNGEATLSNTGTMKITVRGQKFPGKVSLWGLKVNTNVFIPSIRQCFKCGQLNHATKFCHNIAKCLRCGEDYDQSHEICDRAPRCLNCGNNHPTMDKTCPDILFKKDITQLMAIKNIEFNEARKLLRPSPPAFNDMTSFPPLLSPDGLSTTTDPEHNSTNRIGSLIQKGTNKSNVTNKINRNIINKKPLYNLDSNNYAIAAKNNLKFAGSVDLIGEGAPPQTPVSEADFKNLISLLTCEFKKLTQKLDDHIQNQLYVFQNVQDTPMELPEYSVQETRAGISLVEL